LFFGLAAAAAAQPVGSITEYPVPTSGGQPFAIAYGPDGGLWFTEWSGNQIGRISTSGAVTEYPIPTSGALPAGIAVGSDGALWFTEWTGNKIGRITTAGVVTEYPLPVAASVPAGIAAGPDGALWFTEWTGNKIGRITTAGAISEFSIPTAASNPIGIASGPDGAVWFTEKAGSKIGRITTAGAIAEYATPASASAPYGIAAGPDGALWFAEEVAGNIGRITVAGSFTEYPVPTASSSPLGITAGPDGALWFTEEFASQIGRITTAGTVTEYAVPTGNSFPFFIAAGPDLAVGFAEFQGNRIGRVFTGGPAGVPEPVVLASSGTSLYRVVPATGASSLIGAMPVAMTSLASFSGALYGLAQGDLYRINPNSGAASIVGSTVVGSLAFSSSGRLYGAGGVTGSTLYTVDTTTGATTPVGSGNSSLAVLAFDSAGTLYAIGYGLSVSNSATLFSIDPSTGQQTAIGGTSNLIRGMAFYQGTMYGFTEATPVFSNEILSINLSTGETTNVSSVLATGGFGGTAVYTPSSLPGLVIAKTHAGNFVQGQQGATYTVTVSNFGAAATSGAVTVTETVPAGLSLVSMAGAGWTCSTGGGTTCTRSDALRGAAGYPPITVTVNVAANATSPQVNAAMVSGGGSVSAAVTDSTVITAQPPVLSIAKTHTGNFLQGQQGATYTVSVSNASGVATSGSVTVTETPPAGLALVSMAGTGWACAPGANSCTRSDALAGGASYPPITVTVNVAFNAASPQVNMVSVSGGGAASASASDTTVITALSPVLRITKTHTGNFSQSQQGVTYTVTVSDVSPVGASGLVTVTETVPAGLTLVSMAGAGWTCPTGGTTCTRSDALAGGISYPAITVTVNVAANATSPQVNAATVSGGGAASASATDSTLIMSSSPVLGITKTHTLSFLQGQQGVTYTVTVSNASGVATSGLVTITESVPSGLSLVSMAGAGWNCAIGGTTCTRSDALAGGASYPAITVTVIVAADATSPQVNTVNVSGGGAPSASATDSTIINPSEQVTVGEFPVPAASSGPNGIAAGPDGALWFTELNGNQIGRITTAGTISEFPIPAAGSSPASIAAGADGALWFTEFNGNKIGRITTAGAFTEFPIPTAGSAPASITAGPDGALWFTESHASKIGRITTAGAISEFAVSALSSNPQTIAAGPGGALWFTEAGPKIGRITTAGAFTEFTTTSTSLPTSITAGPDGALWFTDNGALNTGGANYIDRITTVGALTQYPIASPATGMESITVGSDGALWFTETAGAIGRMTTVGVESDYSVATANAAPAVIAPGPDGALWFTENLGGKIGRVALVPASLSISKTHSGNFTQGQQGVYTVTVSNTGGVTILGQISVVEQVPLPQMTLLSMAGTGWSCNLTNAGCSRTDGLAAGASFPPITVAVAVALGAPSPLVNTVRVFQSTQAGIATDSTIITPVPLLTIYKYHVGSFLPGRQGATYTVTVSNLTNSAPTSGAVTVTESLPSELSLVSMAGNGWSCASNTCTRSDALAGGATYPPITVMVNVGTGATSPQINAVIVSGGGSASASATDPTTINTYPAGLITEYPLPTAGSGPNAIVAGPDGALWFTELSGSRIGRITTAGVISEFVIPTAVGPIAIASGSDGALWFAEGSLNKIARITTAGAISEFPVPTANSVPQAIASGPDGALWFTEFNAGQIGRITTAGAFTEFVEEPYGVGAPGITAGPDGALWFTGYSSNLSIVGRITTSGSITEDALPASSHPAGITGGPDGALWFAEEAGNKIARITTAGAVTEYPIPTPAGNPAGIASGPDGALWFTETNGNQIGVITTSGSISEFLIPTAFSGPQGITAGPDGALWFTEFYGNKIGRIRPSNQTAPTLSVTLSHTGSFLQGQQGATYTVTVSNAPGAGSTSGTPTVTETLPAGLTLVSMAGPGWNCTGNTCTRSDALAGGASYPAIIVTVNVASNASSPQVNAVTVSGGSATASATDSTIITGGASGLAFYPVTPCRVADTRNPNGTFGGPMLAALSTRSFPILQSACGIPSTAQAYSLNITVVPAAGLTYLTVWPTGQAQPLVSTLNALNGAILANAAIVVAGTGGAISVYASDSTQLITDINGYFAPQSAQGLAFYPAASPLGPCRVADTRNANGPFGGPPLAAGSTRIFSVTASMCGIPSTAQAFSLNMTVAPSGALRYLTTWPAGQSQPVVSTLNALQGQIAANAAIVPAAGGAISVYASDPTNVVIDINGYFAPPGSPGELYFYAVMPCRVADTRNPTGPFGGPALGAGATRVFLLASSACGIPAAAQAYSLNMTVAPPGPLNYLTTWPLGLPRPLVSTLNDLQGQIVANAAIVQMGLPPSGAPLGPGGISVFVSDATNLIIDINGYFGQ